MYLLSQRFYNSLDAIRSSPEITTIAHPDYVYHKEDWNMIRDVLLGERRIKSFGEEYLPKNSAATREEYDDFKERAVFTNMVGRTLSGMVGTIFARPIETDNVDSEAPMLQSFDGGHQTVSDFGKAVGRELLTTGRVGVLVDRKLDSKPYAALYTAEHIIAWVSEKIKGKEVYQYVLLRELVEYISQDIKTGAMVFNVDDNQSAQPSIRARYRMLYMENGVYKQRVFEYGVQESALIPVSSPIIPTKNGSPLKEIPFWIVGLEGLSSKVTRSPILDMVSLNLAHYKTSGVLEQGRYNTSAPVYYIPTNGEDEKAEYVIASNRAWQVPLNSKPGILEYYGTGLRELANSLREKEQAIEKIGGKIIGGSSDQGAGQNAEVQAQNQTNETSTLLNAAAGVSSLLTQVTRFMFMWENQKGAERINVIVNEDFKNVIGAREMRAIALLNKEGLLPISAVFNIFKQNALLPEDMELRTFRGMLNNLNEFPNNPDVEAKQQGYDTAADMHRIKLQRELQEKNGSDTLELQEEAHNQALELEEMKQEHQGKMEKVKAKAAASKPAPAGPLGLAKKPAAKKPAVK